LAALSGNCQEFSPGNFLKAETAEQGDFIRLFLSEPLLDLGEYLYFLTSIGYF